MAIARVPEGNGYAMIGRCAGTGNRDLPEGELPHCIVPTTGYKVLQELVGPKVRHIIPPYETRGTFHAGPVAGAGAPSEEYIAHPVIRQYMDNPGCTIILSENPPYAGTTSAEHQRDKAGEIFPMEIQLRCQRDGEKYPGETEGPPSDDMGNAFIWPAFHGYLRQPADSYIVFSPARCWKAQHLACKKSVRGFAFNRRHFHANIDACMMCALRANVDDGKTSQISLQVLWMVPCRNARQPAGYIHHTVLNMMAKEFFPMM